MRQKQKTINLSGKSLTYTVRTHARIRHLKLTVLRNLEIVVTRPRRGVKQGDVDEFLREHDQWIADRLARFAPTANSDFFNHSKEHFEKHKEAAQILVDNKVAQWNRIYGFEINNVRVKRQTARWGSCSTKRNLNFNYKLLFVPEHIQDYVVVHELCHLAEMNHSPRFWAQVERALPNYRKVRAELRSSKYEL